MNLTRRAALTGIAAAAASLRLSAQPGTRPAPLAAMDEAFLDDMERRATRFFLEQADPISGQVLDRARAGITDGQRDPRRLASIAATGFGLSALAIADHRGYADPELLRQRVRATLRFHAHTLPHQHGFFSHFNDVLTGVPAPGSEVSSIDTALLLCGVLTARAHFAHGPNQDPEIVQLATLIYERVDWPWMLNGGDLFSMGWHPPSSSQPGFLKSTWNHYCELMMIPLLALGSPTHPVDPRVWTAWSRPGMSYDGLTWIGADDPLFVHQFSHAWFDLRNRQDPAAANVNYFQNSITATRAHKAFCLDQGKPYSNRYWGITASDSAEGYKAWGGPPKFGGIDGSVVPCATAGSLPFLPQDCLLVLRSLKQLYGDRCWGRYGFCDALHPAANWYDPDVLGIDLGIGMLMAENLRTGFLWQTFQKNPEVAVAMKKANLVQSS